jgi:hypothetical protein
VVSWLVSWAVCCGLRAVWGRLMSSVAGGLMGSFTGGFEGSFGQFHE